MPNKSNKAKRLSIFRFCAPLASKILEIEELLYVCPICGEKFPEASAENGQLTLEDIPPRSMGGTGLLLTCKTCNSRAGYKIDNYIKTHLDMQKFVQTILEKDTANDNQIFCNLLINDEDFPARVSQKSGNIEIQIIRKASNPNKVNKLKDYFEVGVVNNSLDGSEFKLTKTDKFDTRKWKLAFLKSGFLLLTAMLGYTYAFDKRLLIVREQISHPEKNLLGSLFWFKQNKKQPFPKRRIIMVSTPLPLFLVTFDENAVILPHLSSPVDLYAEMKTNWKEGVVNMKGKVYEWPQKPLMILDSQQLN